MGRTCILEGKRVTGKKEGQKGAVFFNEKTGIAFGPVFSSREEAGRFATFLAGVDPADLHDDFWLRDYGVYKLWLELGKPEKRPLVQLDESYLNQEESEHEECLDCDALGEMHRKGQAHCYCGEMILDNGKCVADDGSEKWSMACSLVEHCFPLFNGLDDGNHAVTKILKKAGVLGDCETDPEYSCFYAYFKNKAGGLAFLERLNGWLRDNWHKAYP